MIRFYANQAGYLPKGRKIAVLAQENRADEMEKMQDKKVSLWNEKGEQTAVKQVVYAGVDESAEDKVWHIDFSDLTEEGTVTFQDGEGAVEPDAVQSAVFPALWDGTGRNLCRKIQALYLSHGHSGTAGRLSGKKRKCKTV